MISKAIQRDVQQGAVIVLLAVVATVIEPVLKVVNWEVFGDWIIPTRLYRVLRTAGISSDLASPVTDAAVFSAPTLAICLILYAIIGRRYYEHRGLTRCRRCKHILQKLSEPRCPECGEAI